MGLTVKSSTDEHMQWNRGSTRNLGPGVLEEMDFKKPKYGKNVNYNAENHKTHDQYFQCLCLINL